MHIGRPCGQYRSSNRKRDLRSTRLLQRCPEKDETLPRTPSQVAVRLRIVSIKAGHIGGFATNGQPHGNVLASTALRPQVTMRCRGGHLSRTSAANRVPSSDPGLPIAEKT